MLTHKVLTRQDVGDVASYYADGADDYYAKEGEAQVWQGKGAELLGLVGEVEADRFRQLLAGRVDPGSTARRSTRDDAKTRIGIDLTFSAPKSVSLLALIGGDTAVVAAHDRAVARTLEDVERCAQARQKIDGISQVETTGNLIIAKFRHETTRAYDPALHTHAVVMNLTRRADGEWRALHNDEIVRATAYMGAEYRAHLARELENLGHELRYGPQGTFELARFSRNQVEAFSVRSREIEEELARKGLTRETASRAERQAATMETRGRKEPHLDRAELHAEWGERAREVGLDLQAGPRARGLFKIVQSLWSPAKVAEHIKARLAVASAMRHIGERDAAVSNERLVAKALEYGMDGVRPGAIFAAIREAVADGEIVAEAPRFFAAGERAEAARTVDDLVRELVAEGQREPVALELVQDAIMAGRLIEAPRRYTTSQAIGREEKVLRIEREGRGALTPLAKDESALGRLLQTRLNAGQLEAVRVILTTPNRVVGVEGLAGTGKSFMLKAAGAEVEHAGHKVRMLAPYGGQVKALRELGLEAKTVASFLGSQRANLDHKTVLVIDEAGVIPARQMAKVLAAAQAAGSRVVLIGDRAQTKAIEAGRPFDQLVRAGMPTAGMMEIQRQSNPLLREAVGLAAEGATKAALEKLGDVIEIRDAGARRRTMAEDYVRLSPEARTETLLISNTNEGRREINIRVREALGLTGQGKVLECLVRRDTTQEERLFARNYHVGDRIQPEQDHRALGLKRGDVYTVVDTVAEKLTLRSATGDRLRIDPVKLRNVSVYEPVRQELARGDVVRITRNDAAKDLANGDRFTVAYVSAAAVVLESDKRQVTLPLDRPLHIDCAYATTAHSSQGLTVDRVLIEAETNRKTTARDTFYVAISRARLHAYVYTNDAHDLPRAIDRDVQKSAALDLQRQVERPSRADRGWERARVPKRGGDWQMGG
ncbi:MAG: conjugative relaxase [Phenylobacterium sp.]|uniref:MobF family relaxase n=1 Tax=Phenylobacterium sp. TaxID=1871053 RepID=UPI00120793D5|nr:MobF family relaxase [Phenylobacterium sp.]TAJ72812.1 MAG: conjugative relaxase [Phenylobacterium sp.]